MTTMTTLARTALMPAGIAGRAARPAVVTWERLLPPEPARAVFDPGDVAGLPEPAKRWLTHAITPGTPLARAAILEMEGRIRLQRWIPFRAVQLHVPSEGYVWAARARLGPLPICGFDRYAEGAGEMHWSILGRIPVMSAVGSDVTRSAAGRLALDAVFVPTAFLTPAVVWRENPGRSDWVFADWTVGNETHRLEIHVGLRGELLSVCTTRWANPNGRAWGLYPCGGTLGEEVDCGGITIPSVIRAGYFFGTDGWDEGEFFRARLTQATFI